MQRRIAGIVVALVGVAFIGSVIVNDLFSVGPAFERMSDGFRPVMQTEVIAALEQDLTGLQAVSDEFTTTGMPMLSQALGMTAEDFGAFMGEQFADVATGVEQLPAIVTNFQGVVGTLKAEQDHFAKADAIPTSSLPATTVPWGLTIAGVVLLALGALILLRPGKGAPIAAVVVGVLLLVAPFALSLPGKAAAADKLNENLEPVYTAELITGANQALGVVGAMGTQMQEAMLPALGQQLGMDDAGLQTFLGENLPATAAGMQGMPDAMQRFATVVGAFEAHLDDYNTLKPVAFVPVVWTMILGGAIALLFGAWALFAAGSGRP
jgi:hypothetical protein